MKGKTLEKIAEETGISRATLFHWSAKYKWQVDREVELNNKLFEIRESVIGDRGLKIQELIEWQQKQLEDIKRQIEEEFEEYEPQMGGINARLATIDQYLKMQFKLLGIRYTGELTDLVRVANQIETNERKLNIEEIKANSGLIEDKELIIEIKGAV